MRRVLFAIFVAAAACATACDTSSPSQPTKTVSSLSLSPGTDWLKIKGTEKFSATVQYTTGGMEPVTPSWSSDNAAVATVDASGIATGVAAGLATLTASFQGASATRTLRVIPDYAGRWSGNWGVTNCTVEGEFLPNWCDPVRNGSFPATLDIQQTKDVVSATWTLQEATGTAQGNIATDGKLSLTGSSLQSGVTIEISSWQTVTTDNRSMTGTFTLTWRTPQRPGSAKTAITLQNFNKQ